MILFWAYIYAGMITYLLLVTFNKPSIERVKEEGMTIAICGGIIVTLLWAPAVAIGFLLSIAKRMKNDRV